MEILHNIVLYAVDKNPYAMRSVTSFYRREIQKLKKLLADNHINWEPVLNANRQDKRDYYVTVYRKPNGDQITRITMYAPSTQDGKRYLKTGDSNCYGWTVIVVMYCKFTY